MARGGLYARAHPRARRGEEGGGGGGAVVDELARDGLQLDGRRRLARRRRGERALAERRRRREARERRSRSGSRRLEELLEAVERDEAARRRPADEQRELLGARPAHRAHERRVGLRVAHDAHAAVERPVGVPRVHVAADGGPRDAAEADAEAARLRVALHLALAQRAAQLLRQLARQQVVRPREEAVGPLLGDRREHRLGRRGGLAVLRRLGGRREQHRVQFARRKFAEKRAEERGEELGASVAARSRGAPSRVSSHVLATLARPPHARGAQRLRWTPR